MRYIKKPVVVEATQWFKNGDHPWTTPTNKFDWYSQGVADTEADHGITSGEATKKGNK